MDCPSVEPIKDSVLIVHLGALGAVVRSTSLLAAVRRHYPQSHITWVTQAPADQLLRNHPWIDRVLSTSAADQLILKALKFDVGLVIDKSLSAVALAESVQVDHYFGFTAHPKTGAILPANILAEELWSLGLDNHKKFFVNEKPETQLQAEALGLTPFQRDEYQLPLTSSEAELARLRAAQWRIDPQLPVIGMNTGCSQMIPYKKLTVDYHRRLISKLLSAGYKNLVLLGGAEDAERNQAIGLGLPVFQSPTAAGLRDGLTSVAACDLVLTGDSLGMHLAISQKKFVAVWFGPTCAQEIDLYGRGRKILSKATCAPCWKSLCANTQMCYDQVAIKEWIDAVVEGHQFWQKEFSSYKQHFLETSF